MVKKGQFQRAVEATATVAHAFRAGAQALEERDRKLLDDIQLATGSLALDKALQEAELFPNDNRWDYGMSLSAPKNAEKVLWLEPHHAGSGQAEKVIKKLKWLRNWLRQGAPELEKVSKESVFVWLVTSKENPNDRQRRTRMAREHGLRRVSGRFRLSEV